MDGFFLLKFWLDRCFDAADCAVCSKHLRKYLREVCESREQIVTELEELHAVMPFDSFDSFLPPITEYDRKVAKVINSKGSHNVIIKVS